MLTDRIITLLTDFGEQDVYVGVMKGVIAQINAHLKVIDLTHHLPPQNIAIASYQLTNAYTHFPPETVHVVVVDPGVGSQRRGIALKNSAGFFVGPDNGVFSQMLQQCPATAIVELQNSQYWYRQTPSFTFHGRDIFAPVAAHLASGVALAQLGPMISPTTLIQGPIPSWEATAQEIIGTIQAIDHFGNLITSIPGACVVGQAWVVEVAGMTLLGGETYSDTRVGGLVGLVGSHGWVEIGVNCGNAEAQLQQRPGATVKVRLIKDKG